MILASASLIGLVLALAAATAYTLPAALARQLSVNGARNALLAAWLLHGGLLAWTLLGDGARFGFAPALSVTVWLVLTVYAVESQAFPQLRVRGVMSGIGAAAVLMSLVFPGSPMLQASSPWLPLHAAVGLASYGLFGAAVLHAWLMQRAEKDIRKAAPTPGVLPLLTLERLTFRLVGAGFALLSLTLLAGVLFSESLYGRGWRWDHKTIFSLLSWLAFALLLVGRSRFGWRGRKAVRVLYTGTVLLLLAYAGTRFVLEVLLGRSG